MNIKRRYQIAKWNIMKNSKFGLKKLGFEFTMNQTLHSGVAFLLF